MNIDLVSNETPNFQPFRVEFWDWNHKGVEQRFTGLAVSEFTDPEDYRSSYHVKLDAECAQYPNHHMDPYVSECREI